MYAPQYAATPRYVPYEFRPSPMTPTSAGEEGYFAPRQPIFTSTLRPRGHSRRASHEPSKQSFAPSAYHNTPIYTTFHPSPYASKRDSVPVQTERMRTRSRPHNISVDHTHHSTRKHSSKTSPAYVEIYLSDSDDSPSGGSSPNENVRYSRGYTTFDRTPSHKHTESSRRSRPRATSYTQPSQHSSQKHQRPSTARAADVATPADALAHNIPAGFSLKNWDPTEAPVILLGSVFDANSLGKWIYDWTVFAHGPASPMADQAGELWLLLIQLAGKMKRSEEVLPRVRFREDSDMIEDFLESGDRLWKGFKNILKACEEYMWRAARRESSLKRSGPVSMGASSGKEFVASIFGRDRQLEATEQLMQRMRYWIMRFDANCEQILRRPSG